MKQLFFLSLLLLISSICNSMEKNDNQVPMDIDEQSVFSQLMKASWKNNTSKVQQLATHANIQEKEMISYGSDPLGWAAYHKNVEMTQALLAVGFRPESSDGGGSAIHTAVCSSTLPVLKELLTYPLFLYVDKQEIQKRVQALLGCIKKVVAPQISLTVDKLVKCKLLPSGYLARCTTLVPVCQQQQEVNELVKQHLIWIKEQLQEKIAIDGNLIMQTPYEIAKEKGHHEVAEFLQPHDFDERIQPLLITSYKSAISGKE